MASNFWDTWSRRAEVFQIVGLPDQAASDYREAIRLMQQVDPEYFNVSIGRLGAEVVELESGLKQVQKGPKQLTVPATSGQNHP